MAKIYELLDIAVDLNDISAIEKLDTEDGPSLRIHFKSDPTKPATTSYDTEDTLDEIYEDFLHCWRLA